MAPSQSTLKRPAASILKRPAASILKKPAAKDPKVKEPEGEEEEKGEPVQDGSEDGPKLTHQALVDHQKFLEETKDLDEKNFLAALQKLDSGASMRLWKQFQNSRKSEGQEEDYNNAVSNGIGAVAKKRKLLYGWAQSDQTCGEQYRKYMHQISLVKSSGVKEKWLTTAQAVSTWGKDELWARVKAGTISARKCPQDPRFYEFKNVQQVAKTEASHTKKTSITHSGKLDKKTALEYENQEWGQVVEADWQIHEEEEEAPENVDADLAKALGVKLPKTQEEKNKDKPEKELETASKISAADSKADILDKVMRFKAELEKDKSQLDSKEYEAKKAGVKDAQLYKDKKEVAAKLEAPSAYSQSCFRGARD